MEAAELAREQAEARSRGTAPNGAATASAAAPEPATAHLVNHTPAGPIPTENKCPIFRQKAAEITGAELHEAI
jgi:hypothetical protein